MAHATPQGRNLLNGFKRLTRFDKGLGAQLPEAYKKFWREWKEARPAAVHYIPKEGEWERDEVTGQLRPIQNIPLPLIDPPESHEGIWGGEAVIKGFQKRHRLKRRVPHFWVPVLRRSVLHSQVLNKYLSVVITDRTMEKIHECFGFDHYLLKHPACDLRSALALKLKRKILLELLNGCPSLAGNSEEQSRVYKEFKCYLEGYTPEEIEWYGHTYDEAIRKLQGIIRAQNQVKPHKVEYRMRLIEQLKQAGITVGDNVTVPTLTVEESAKQYAALVNETSTSKSANTLSKSTAVGANKMPASVHTPGKSNAPVKSRAEIEDLSKIDSPDAPNWLSKINPFGKKEP